MKVILLTGCYLPGYKGGGPIKTISNLVASTSTIVEYKVVTSDRDLGDITPYKNVTIGDWNETSNSSIFYAENGIKGIKQIFKIIAKIDCNIIYLNSFFSLRFSIIPLLIARFLGKSIILAPRGEFSKGALSLKALKKKVYILFFKLFSLKNITFQASSIFEENDIKKVFGEKAKIFIAENIGSQNYAKNLTPKDKSVLKIAFLSRISPIKNLTYALKVLSKIKKSIQFDIYGPLEDKTYWQECQDIIENMPENIKVNYKGQLNPNMVVDTLSEYDLFFMPTQGENYGHVIAEALCAGLPLLIADTTPWRDLQEKGIGWDISLNESEEFINAINSVSDMTVEEHYILREKVLCWAKHKFSQDENIKQNIAMFRYAIEDK
ncbi:glycosyltransferase [Acinetobacter indicus]|uniref:glycosyltransferase n=1 Tax=Acinetobacter indicus TaxID=756892 RepID=UPI000CEB87C9|nr:glycosyltransferase [Acinetobacter indicus]